MTAKGTLEVLTNVCSPERQFQRPVFWGPSWTAKWRRLSEAVLIVFILAICDGLIAAIPEDSN